MIKSENGKVEMRGNVTDLLAELSLIVASLYEVISEYDDKKRKKSSACSSYNWVFYIRQIENIFRRNQR